MDNLITFGTVAEMLGIMSKDPMKFMRTSQVIGFDPEKRLFGQASVLDYNSTDGSAQFARNTVFLHKVLITRAEKGGINGFLTATNRLDDDIVNGIFASIGNKLCTFPPDGHLRYKFSAPMNTTLTSYYYEDSKVKRVDTTEPQTLTMAPIMDMQNVRHPDGTQQLHTLVGSQIYSCAITRGNITNGAPFKWKKAGEALCLLSLPGAKPGETNLMIGTENGVILGQDTIHGTEKFRIESITVDSENSTVYYRTGNYIYGFPMKDKFTRVADKPRLVCEVPQGFPWMLAGPAVFTENTPGILFTAWEKAGKTYNHSYKTMPTTPPNN